MTTDASLQESSSSHNPPKGRSLLSRLASPLSRSRPRNLEDFHIQPHEPHRQYSPGDIVKGLVVLTVRRPIRITHLTVALNGYIHVSKTPNGAADGWVDAASLPVGSTKKTQYLGRGHVSLFQDEQILCGEGRLDPGIFEFEFELEFPKKGLPTSVDFERGTIAYMLRATITRPTTIAAVSSCDRKISLVEIVDIGLLVPPKPRIITLEPISRRSRKSTKAKARSEKDTHDGRAALDASHRSNSPIPEESSSQSGSSEQAGSQRMINNGDDQSEVSAESVISSSTGRSWRLGSGPASNKSLKNSQTFSDQSSPEIFSNKTITATIELLKAGCLPGDCVPLRISIQHTKAIRSMHGIIITLYRLGRVDYAPPLSPFMDVTGKEAERLKHEEYYPKSKTGLGGLSLSSAGSNSVFQKDLSQTFAPLIINPATMSTVVTASIRVPEDAFPTITGVPAQMVDFKYHIEVVVDLGGKLAAHDRHVPRTSVTKSTYIDNNNQVTSREDGPGNFLNAWGGSIVETDHIRREKSVVSCTFELVVGTTDSALMRGRGNTLPRSRTAKSTATQSNPPVSNSGGESEHYQDPVINEHHDELQYNGDRQPEMAQSHNVETDGHRGTFDHSRDYDIVPEHRFRAHHEQPFPPPIPPPEVAAEMDLPEKERARRAEQRLLPSRPSGDEAGPSLSMLSPSAPAYLEAEDPVFWNYISGPNFHNPQARPSAPLDDSVYSNAAPTAPPHDEVGHHTTNTSEEDKQELERQRLLAEASSPANFPNDDHVGEQVGREMHFTPTAPFLDEEVDYGGHHYHQAPQASHAVQEELPGYHR